MTILLSDPVVHAIRVRDNGDPLVPLPFAPGVLVRAGLADRLAAARAALSAGLDLRVVEGHRTVADQRAIIESYSTQLRVLHPDADEAELTRLYSRFVAPVAVAPRWWPPRSPCWRRAAGFLVARALAALGVVSYGTYLWDHPLTLWPRPDLGAVAGPLAAGLTIVAAALSWRFVEEPATRRVRSRSP